MLIISKKYKDYYDYLQGIYGVDKKVVLDRSKSEGFVPSDRTGFTLHLCDFAYDCWFQDKEYFWCERIKEVAQRKYYFDDTYTMPDGRTHLRDKVIPSNINKKYNCPIVVTYRFDKNSCNYPTLKNLNFVSVLSAKEVYLKLATWLSKEPEVLDTRTNEEKIQTNGFDIKKSFRHRK